MYVIAGRLVFSLTAGNAAEAGRVHDYVKNGDYRLFLIMTLWEN